MKYKYLILDFGNVLAMPSGLDWDITPKFMELIDLDKFDIERFKRLKKRYGYILSETMTTLEEEYDMFTRFYDSILSNCKYPNYTKELSEQIAFDRTYKNGKYKLCDNVIKELKQLKKKYKLICLTDNWPCGINYMKDNKLYNFFEKVYLSCEYGCLKQDGVFFDYPIKDFKIKKGEALFIDDAEINLDEARKRGLDVLLMDRYKKVKTSKYKIINDLLDL